MSTFAPFRTLKDGFRKDACSYHTRRVTFEETALALDPWLSIRCSVPTGKGVRFTHVSGVERVPRKKLEVRTEEDACTMSPRTETMSMDRPPRMISTICRQRRSLEGPDSVHSVS